MIRGKLVAFQNIERCEASRVACLLLLFLMAAMCCLPSLPPGSPLLGQLQTLVGSEVSEPDHLSMGLASPRPPIHAKPLEDHIMWHRAWVTGGF